MYKENLKKIIEHPVTRAQNPRIIMITIPPVNEYQLEKFDNDKDTPHPSRTASGAKAYATAAREVAASLNIPVADAWSAFMATADWKEGQPLPGSRDLPNTEEFSSLFTDGMFNFCLYRQQATDLIIGCANRRVTRSTPHLCWLPYCL